MRRALLFAALALVASCDGPADGEEIDRSAFVATYIDLRRATVAGELDPATRDSILEAHGTDEQSLRAYIEGHAEDPDAIADTWREIMDSIAARDSVANIPDTTALEPDSAVAEPDTSSDS